jgi:hypothetical protein
MEPETGVQAAYRDSHVLPDARRIYSVPPWNIIEPLFTQNDRCWRFRATAHERRSEMRNRISKQPLDWTRIPAQVLGCHTKIQTQRRKITGRAPTRRTIFVFLIMLALSTADRHNE